MHQGEKVGLAGVEIKHIFMVVSRATCSNQEFIVSPKEILVARKTHYVSHNGSTYTIAQFFIVCYEIFA